MLKLAWSEDAIADLETICSYIGERNFNAAAQLRATSEACAERLAGHPFMHRVGRTPGTREAVIHPNYILIYEVSSDIVVIRSMIHSRRQYPPDDGT